MHAGLERAAGAAPPAPAALPLERVSFREDAAWTTTEDGVQAKLTLDPALHRATERLLHRAAPRSGAVVVLHARTGEVLVWAERTAPGEPAGSVMNATSIPAASVIKIVTTAALLEAAHVSPERSVCTDGGHHRVDREHLTRPERGQAVCGPFSQALGLSRNAAFAQLVHRFLSRDKLEQTARRLGFGCDVPFDAPIPMGTLELPEDDLGYARAATGFLGSTLTPLGGAYLASLVATRGRALQIHLLENPEGDSRRYVGRRMDDATAYQLRRMMEFTVHGGTSLRAFSDPNGRSYLGGIRVAGKTGTLRAAGHSTTTSWFVGFAPSRNPQIVLSVLLNNAPTWRRMANEVARDVLRAYFAARRAAGVTAPDI